MADQRPNASDSFSPQQGSTPLMAPKPLMSFPAQGMLGRGNASFAQDSSRNSWDSGMFGQGIGNSQSHSQSYSTEYCTNTPMYSWDNGIFERGIGNSQSHFANTTMSMMPQNQFRGREALPARNSLHHDQIQRGRGTFRPGSNRGARGRRTGNSYSTVDQSQFAGFEAEKRFPDPKEKLHNILQNATKSPHKLCFKSERMQGRFWRAIVTIPWPRELTASGEGTDMKDAEKRAAALACAMLEDMGLAHADKGGGAIKKGEIEKENEPCWIHIQDDVLSMVESVFLKTLQQRHSLGKHDLTDDGQLTTDANKIGNEVREIFSGGPFKLLSYEEQQKLNAELQEEYHGKQRTSDVSLLQIRGVTSKLPVAGVRSQVTTLIDRNKVVVISGETGCGKTTQIPQFILDDAIQKGTGSTCNIVVTQPRRIVAMSIAERVAKERGEDLGNSIGYQVRLESKLPKRPGRILFCTTGILLSKLQGNPWLQGVSHVIVDEVHERDINTDFLLVLLRDLIDTCPSLRIIVMSATVDADRFCSYFANCPRLNIPGFTYPVTEYFLPEIQQMLPPRNEESSKSHWLPGVQQGKRFKPSSSNMTADEQPSPEVDPDLVTDVILHVSRTFSEGAILCFLAGWDEIMTVHELLMEKIPHNQKCNYLVLPLHSMLPTFNQRQVFDRPPAGVRKIVLATNIAETSITIDDVVYVVNAGNLKEKTYDAQCKVSCLMTHWSSKASVTQRRGRAGRCSPGYCFNLFSRSLLEGMENYQQAEILRVCLEEIVLQAKIQRPSYTAQNILAKTLDPPLPQSVHNAVVLLQDIGALDQQEKLTSLGRHMATLPVDPKIAKMIIYGTVFRCLDPILTIAASLGYKDPFVTPLHKRQQADKARYSFVAGTRSDHVVVLNAFEGWKQSIERGQEKAYIDRNYLHRGTLNMIQGIRDQFYRLLSAAGLVPLNDDGRVTNMYAGNLELVKAILCAGFYPNVIKLGLRLESKGKCGKKRARIACRTRTDGRVAMHPSSVNVSEKFFNSRWLVYHEKVKSTQVFIRDSSMVHPVALVLFAGKHVTPVDQSPGQVTLAVDGDSWIGFHCTPRLALALQSLRGAVEDMVSRNISTAKKANSVSYNTNVTEAVMALLNTQQQPYRAETV